MTMRKQGVLLFCILIFCYACLHQGMGWNQNSRLDFLHALLVQKTFKIDAYHKNTEDKSIHAGHYYSDKAPGIVFLAMPAFAFSASILSWLDVPLESPRGWIASSWIATVGSVGVITALGGVAMFALLTKLVGRRNAFIATLAVFLGSLPFPYATMLFSHAAVIGLVCIALWAIADPVFLARMTRDRPTLTPTLSHPMGEGGVAPWLKRYVLAGFCCGLAISSEYTATTAAGGVLALAFLMNFRRGAVLALAAVPPLLLIPICNWICFGGPLAFGYHHLALPEFQGMNKGLFGITFPPKAGAAYLILFSPERGLFFWTPFFLSAFFGVKSFWSRYPVLFWVAVVTIALHVMFISGYYLPGGGAALGPRHLAPMLPFATLVAACGLRRYPALGITYGAYSIVMTGFATLIEAMPSDNVTNPLLAFYVPHLLRGQFAHNIAFEAGLSHFIGLFIMINVMLFPYVLACCQRVESASVGD